MVSLRKSRQQALLAAATAARTNRRSTRLVELEERRRQEEAARAAVAAQETVPPPAAGSGQVTGRKKRGRKKKHVAEVTVNSVYEEGSISQWQAVPSFIGSSTSYWPGTPVPSKKTLESLVDILQMMDCNSMLCMPEDLLKCSFEDNLCKPPDFGTVRAKIHDGFYTTFEHFESDIFTITSMAKRPNQPDTPIHKLASCIRQKAAEVFHALKTQPGFELQVRKWAASNRKTTGQLRIGSRAAASAAPSAAGDGNQLTNAAAYARRGSARGNRGNRRIASARPGGDARRGRRRTSELPIDTVQPREDRRPQCLPEDRRWTYLRQEQPQELYAMMLQSPQQLDIRVGREIPYEKSLMNFAGPGGPIAESIARKVMEEQRAAAIEIMERRIQLPNAPANSPVLNNSDLVSPTLHVSGPYPGLPAAQEGMPPPSFYHPTAKGGAGPSSSSSADPTGVSSFSFPPPSIAASSAAFPSYGAGSHSYWPTSDVGSSSVTAGYKYYPHAANVPPSRTVDGGEGSACPGSSAGEGSSTSSFLFGPRKLNYAPLFSTGSTSAAPGYQQPAPAPQSDVSEFLQLGSCNKGAACSSKGKQPVEHVDGFQYLLSAGDGHLVVSGLGGGPSGVTPADVSTSLSFPSGNKRAAVEAQPEPMPQATSQAVFDLKLLQSRLGENPWGKNGISALRPGGFSANNSDNRNPMEAGSSTPRPAERGTLDLLGGQNPDLNLNL